MLNICFCKDEKRYAMISGVRVVKPAIEQDELTGCDQIIGVDFVGDFSVRMLCSEDRALEIGHKFLEVLCSREERSDRFISFGIDENYKLEWF